MNHVQSQCVSPAYADVETVIDGRSLAEGDALIGLAGFGIQTGGLSLVRKVFDDPDAPLAELDGMSPAQALQAPVRTFDRAVDSLLRSSIGVHAILPITGSLYENVPRMMPGGLTAQIILHRLPHLPILDLIQKTGSLSDREMHNAFSMGIGMILAVPAQTAPQALRILRDAGEDACCIGRIVCGDEGVMLV